jgi:hypothetical protein
MSEHGNAGPDLGGKVGGRLASLVSQATILTRQRMAPHQNALVQKVLQDFTNHVSDEVRGVMGPLWRDAAAHPEVAIELKPLLNQLGTGRGQAWAWLGGTVAGSALGPGLGTMFSMALAPYIQAIVRRYPNARLDPATAASMHARGIREIGAPWSWDALSQGVDQSRFDALVDLNSTYPSVADVLQLYNRNVVGEGDARDLLKLLGFRDREARMMLGLRHVDLSPADLAAMWNRQIVTTAEGRAIAARSGMSGEDFDRMTLLGGEPPDTTSLLLAWRRGVIDEHRVDRALVQGPLRNEWIDVIKQLQWAPLPLSEAADAVNQGHMTLPAARAVARENGIKDRDFDVIIANAGLPPGPQEILDWLNRGIITEAQALQGLYESRIKNSWVPTYIKTRFYVLPPDTIRLLYSRGALTKEQATHKLLDRGLSPEDAAFYIDGAIKEKTQATRDLTATEMVRLYEDRVIDRPTVSTMLVALGYDAEEAEWKLTIADLSRDQKFVNAILARLKAGYLAWRLDDAEVVTAMDSAHVPPDQRDDLLYLWGLERSVVTKGLTTAEIKAALRKSLIDVAGARTRLLAQGYAPDDVDIQIALVIGA